MMTIYEWCRSCANMRHGLLERATAAAAEAASGEASAGEASSSAEARPAGTGSGRGGEHLVHVRRHAVHGTRKEKRTETDVAVWRGVAAWRIFHDAVERLRPMVFDAQRHGVGEEFFERVGRHALDAIGVDAVHEFLESEDRDCSARAGDSLRGHL